MNAIETIRQWLLCYPGWGEHALTVDYTDGKPGSAGLFYMGMEEVSRQTDLQGNALVCNRLHFLLRRVNACEPGEAEPAAWLTDFESWVQQQSTYGLTPQFGCLPGKERLCAKNARLLKVDSPGTAVYQVELFAEFISYQEGWYYDGSGL